MSRPAEVDQVERTGGVHIQVPAEPGYLGVVRLVVHTLAQRRDLDDERIEDVVLAASEACAYVLEARGERASGGRPIQLVWSEEADSCLVEVLDTSGQADVGAVPPDGTSPADPTRAALEGDLSIPLVRALVDDVTASSDAGGSSVTMRFSCGPWLGDPGD